MREAASMSGAHRDTTAKGFSLANRDTRGLCRVDQLVLVAQNLITLVKEVQHRPALLRFHKHAPGMHREATGRGGHFDNPVQPFDKVLLILLEAEPVAASTGRGSVLAHLATSGVSAPLA